MKPLYTVAVVLFAICSFSECLVPKHSLRKRHIAKRDLSEADMEMLLKLLLSKMQSKATEEEVMHKDVGEDPGFYYEPEMGKKAEHEEVEEEIKYGAKSYPDDYEYMKEEFPYEESAYGSDVHKDIKSTNVKVKGLGMDKGVEESFKKEIHYETPEEKIVSETVLHSKGPLVMEKSEKVYKDMTGDKFGDKEESLAESLYHMKIAGDIETYPHVEMASMFDMKSAEEKLHHEKVGAEESYLKKVDEIGKTLFKEEHLDDEHHIVNDEMIKKLKALGLDKELGAEHKELLHGLSKELHKEAGLNKGSIAYEMAKEQANKDSHFLIGEEMKKYLEEALEKGKIHGTEMVFEKDHAGEFHGINTKIASEVGKSLHSFGKEEGKVLEEAFKFDMDKAKFAGKIPLVEGEYKHGVKHEIITEAEKAFKAHEEKKPGIGPFYHKAHEDEFVKKEGLFGTDAFIHKTFEDEHFKKEKAFDADSLLRKAHDELLKKEKDIHADSALHKVHEGEMIKKETAYGKNPYYIEEHEDELMKKETAHGAHSFIHKAHEDELLKKEKAIGADSVHHKIHEDESIKKEIGYGINHKAYEDELIKKGIAYGTNPHIYKTHEEEIKKEKGIGADSVHHKIHEDEMIKKDITHGVDHKVYEDELIKKGIAYGTNPHIYKAHEEEVFKKEKAVGADSVHHKIHEEESIKKEIGYGINHKAYEDELIKKGIAYGTNPHIYKAHEEEVLKKEKAIGADSVHHKIHEDESIKKEIGYGINHKAYEDELIKKGIAYGTNPHIYKAHEEEVLKKEKAVGAGSVHHKIHEDESKKKEITHGIDHKIHEDELIKKEIAHGTDHFLHGIHEDEFLKEEKALKTDSSFHKAHEDELIKKEIAYGDEPSYHKGKDILSAEEGHRVGHEKSHKGIHDLRSRFFELLRKVLGNRKCHLVTMRPRELLGIINCISRSKDPLVCEKFAMCEKKKPHRVIAAQEKCIKETIPQQVKKCTTHAPLFPSSEIPVKIFQCVAVAIRELVPEEQKMMSEFEECARALKAESCSRFKFFRH